MKRRFISCWLVLLIALFPAGALAAPVEVKLSGNVYLLTVTVDNEDEVMVGAVLREVGGKLAVCGSAWMGEKSGNEVVHRNNVLKEVTVTLEGKRVKFNPGLFTVYRSEAEAMQGKARCAPSKQAWNPAYANAPFDLSLRNDTYRD